jgi:hypothetical protein
LSPDYSAVSEGLFPFTSIRHAEIRSGNRAQPANLFFTDTAIMVRIRVPGNRRFHRFPGWKENYNNKMLTIHNNMSGEKRLQESGIRITRLSAPNTAELGRPGPGTENVEMRI